jgi:segregation and condensation protein A
MNESTAQAVNYRVDLEVFEGPLDLLLHLIKKDDLDIYDIPIARLLDHYLEFLKLAQELDIDLAGEFLEMAAELAYIKSKTLLPVTEEEEAEGPDPREELLRRLLEYQKFKAAGTALMSRPLLNQDVFARPSEDREGTPGEILIEPDAMALVRAFQDILKRLPQEQFHEISRQRTGVSERIVELTDFLKTKGRVDFEELFLSAGGEITRSDLIVTFLAVLEMAKQRLIRIIQEKVFHKIIIDPLVSEGEV